MLEPFDAVMRAGGELGAMQTARDGFVKRLNHERRFAAARYAGHAGEQPQWNIHGDVAQVVGACPANGNFFMANRVL